MGVVVFAAKVGAWSWYSLLGEPVVVAGRPGTAIGGGGACPEGGAQSVLGRVWAVWGPGGEAVSGCSGVCIPCGEGGVGSDGGVIAEPATCGEARANPMLVGGVVLVVVGGVVLVSATWLFVVALVCDCSVVLAAAVG